VTHFQNHHTTVLNYDHFTLACFCFYFGVDVLILLQVVPLLLVVTVLARRWQHQATTHLHHIHIM
jgi:hypothetical protein